METANYFRDLFNYYAQKVFDNCQDFDETFVKLSSFAKNMPSAHIKKIEGLVLDRDNYSLSAFSALLSLSIAANVIRVSKETGKMIFNAKNPEMSIVNPSLKDGFCPLALDSEIALALIKQYRPFLKKAVGDFLAQFDKITELIAKRDEPAIRAMVEGSSKIRYALTIAFRPEPAFPTGGNKSYLSISPKAG